MKEVKYEFNYDFFDFLNDLVLNYLQDFISQHDYLKDYLNITKLSEIEEILLSNELDDFSLNSSELNEDNALIFEDSINFENDINEEENLKAI